MENNNVLKASKQKIVVQGILKEKKLELKSSEKGEFISGSVIIKTKDGSEIIVKLFANKYSINKTTNEQTENKLYANLLKVKDQYISEAEIAANNLTDKTPTIVMAKGASFDKNDYYNTKLNRVVEGIVIKAMAIDEIAADKVAPNATFEITAYMQKMSDEIKDDLPTGRQKCTLLFPVYLGKLAAIDVIATDKLSNLLVSEGTGNTYTFYGNIKNIFNEKTIMKQGAVCDIPEIVREVVREYEIYNADIFNGALALPEENEGYLNPDDIKIALADREATLNQLKNDADAVNW